MKELNPMNNEDAISRAELLEIAEQQGHVTVDDIINAKAVPPQVVHGRWMRQNGKHTYSCYVCGWDTKKTSSS